MLLRIPALPAVATLPATAALPAVATLPATATLPTVATLPATAALPAVATLPATARLSATATLPAAEVLFPAAPSRSAERDRLRPGNVTTSRNFTDGSSPRRAIAASAWAPHWTHTVIVSVSAQGIVTVRVEVVPFRSGPARSVLIGKPPLTKVRLMVIT